MRKTPHKPTESDYKNILIMTNKGVSVEKISESIGCSTGLVTKIRKELGIERKKVKKSKKQLTTPHTEKEPLITPSVSNEKSFKLLNKVFR